MTMKMCNDNQSDMTMKNDVTNNINNTERVIWMHEYQYAKGGSIKYVKTSKLFDFKEKPGTVKRKSGSIDEHENENRCKRARVEEDLKDKLFELDICKLNKEVTMDEYLKQESLNLECHIQDDLKQEPNIKQESQEVAIQKGREMLHGCNILGTGEVKIKDEYSEGIGDPAQGIVGSYTLPGSNEFPHTKEEAVEALNTDLLLDSQELASTNMNVSEASDTDATHKCYYRGCFFTSPSQYILGEHVKIEHLNITGPVSCSNCAQTFEYLNDLWIHTENSQCQQPSQEHRNVDSSKCQQESEQCDHVLPHNYKPIPAMRQNNTLHEMCEPIQVTVNQKVKPIHSQETGSHMLLLDSKSVKKTENQMLRQDSNDTCESSLSTHTLESETPSGEELLSLKLICNFKGCNARFCHLSALKDHLETHYQCRLPAPFSNVLASLQVSPG